MPLPLGGSSQSRGGDVVLWSSSDQGATWNKVKQVTHCDRFNANYPKKPVNAQADFFALWADGDTLRPSDSSLYFIDKDASAVWNVFVCQNPDHEGGAVQ